MLMAAPLNEEANKKDGSLVKEGLGFSMELVDFKVFMGYSSRDAQRIFAPEA